jgi:hypothetical protein
MTEEKEEQIIKDGVDALFTQCPICGAVEAVEKQIADNFVVAKSTPTGTIEYHVKNVELYLCTHCNETFFNKHQSQLLDLKLKNEKLRHALIGVCRGARMDQNCKPGWVEVPTRVFDLALEALEEQT